MAASRSKPRTLTLDLDVLVKRLNVETVQNEGLKREWLIPLNMNTRDFHDNYRATERMY